MGLIAAIQPSKSLIGSRTLNASPSDVVGKLSAKKLGTIEDCNLQPFVRHIRRESCIAGTLQQTGLIVVTGA